MEYKVETDYVYFILFYFILNTAFNNFITYDDNRI
jgi:hypothetical protein